MSVGEFIETGADRSWQWFIHMPWWSYVLLVTLALIMWYLIWTFFRRDPTETVEAEVPEFPDEIHPPEDI